MRRILSFTLFQLLLAAVPAQAQVARVELADPDIEAGLANTQRMNGSDGENEVVFIGPADDKRYGRMNWGDEDPTSDTADDFFYFRVNDAAIKGASAFRIAAVIYDNPALAGTTVYLQYTLRNSTGPGDIPNTFYPLNNPPRRLLGGSGRWIEVGWVIEGAGFRSWMQGTSDFRIGIDRSRRVAINQVEAAALPLFRRGDTDGNGRVEVTDPVMVLGFLFLGDSPPSCFEAADADDSGFIDISDAVFSLSYQFAGTAPPPPPGPLHCGPDPTPAPAGGPPAPPCSYDPSRC